MRKLYFLTILLACAYLLPQKVAAKDTCTANFNYSASSLTVSFYSAPGLPASTLHNWIFGDGSAGDASANPVHTYAVAGSYWVKHYIFNQSTNCNDSVIKEIKVPSTNCPIDANFSFYRDSQDCRVIHFINQSTPISPNAHFVWKFGDGTTSNETNPTHRYPNDGNYNVCLVIESGSDCRKEICKQVEIHCTTPPCNLFVDFNWRKDSIQLNKIYFNSIVTASTANVQYYWKFGDGSFSSDKDPIHVYAHGGEFEVCLTVKSGENCSKTVCHKLSIRECDVQARFESKRDASEWNKVWFANLSQPVPNIWRTSWTYGDGTSSQDYNSVHVYQQPGKYLVCLKVQSLQGCIDAFCDTVIVSKPDSCRNHSEFRFEVSANNPLEYRFKPAEVNPYWKYYWEFGDGKSSTAITPTHKYEHAGTYRVCLTVVVGNRCRTSTCKEIRVAAPINCDTVKLKFEYTRTPGTPNQVSFKAISNVPILKQKWGILKIGASAVPPPTPVIIEANNPTYTFRDTGWYLVCLYGETAGNCQKVYCDRIHIERVGNGRIIPGSPVTVYPNPVSNTARIEFEMETASRVTLTILDASGSSQLTFSVMGQAGSNSVKVPVDKLSNGFYIVEIRYANRMKLAKFQKS